jgi:hypothetical protein
MSVTNTSPNNRTSTATSLRADHELRVMIGAFRDGKLMIGAI